jgi:ParB-like chromosome segregation protein Spo0J
VGTSPRRRTPTTESTLWRFLPAGVLAVAAVVTGGLLGVLIGFTAALIAIDRMLDRVLEKVGASSLEAEHAYQRLSRERSRARLDRRLRRRVPESDDLAYLPEDSGWVAVAARRQLGVQPIPVDSVVGTVDSHKATTFDREFRPPEFSRGRWTLMFRAARRGVQLPPISVYRVAGQHFVRDGHHRVSVARALGADAIDAEVTELEPASPPEPVRG